jgi:hypothetical protein
LYPCFSLLSIVPGRQSGVGINVMCGRIGAILAPLIRLLQVYHPAIPMVLYGTIPLIGGLLCFLLPETLNMELQDHTEQRSVHTVVLQLCTWSEHAVLGFNPNVCSSLPLGISLKQERLNTKIISKVI